MNISWLTLRDLEYVIAVAKHEHFGRAAQECHVSQPSMSTQIKKVEGYLGVDLFERNNRRVVVTPAGKRVADQAMIVLAEAQKIPALIGQESIHRMTLLKLGIIFSAAPFIPFALEGIRKTFPGVRINLREGTTHELVQALKAGELDAVVAANTVKDPGLDVVPLFFEPFVLAAPIGHAVLRRQRVKPGDLVRSEMVLLEDGHCLRDQVLKICPSNRRGHLKTFHANSLEALRHLVASGAGYTLLPRLAVKGRPMSHLITYQDLDAARVGRDVVLLHRLKSRDSDQLQKLAQALIGAVPSDLGRIS